MCGIHFAVNNGNATKGIQGFLTDAFYANQVRGVDASGMFQVKNAFVNGGKVREVRYAKEGVDGSTFIQDAGAKELLGASGSQLATVCHVRHATAGKLNKENAHPFTSVRRDGSRIIGVHNGSLRNWKSKKGSENFDVDSAWLYHNIAQDGLDAFDSIDGAYALVWYDSREPDTLFIARNKERPLAWGVTKDGKAMIGASEVGMLGWLADRNNLEMMELIKGYEFVFPEEGYLYKVNLKKPSEYTKDKLPEFRHANTRYDRPIAPAQRVPYVPIDDRDPYDWIGRGPASPYGNRDYNPSRGTNSSSPSTDWEIKRQSNVINSVKAALTKKPVVVLPDKEEEEIVEQLSTALDSLPEEEQLQIKQMLEGEGTSLSSVANANVPGEADGAIKKEKFEYIHHPPVNNVDNSEEAAARMFGIFGLCVNFAGYMYDDDTRLVYGDFRTVENGETHVYDAIVRGVTTKYAEDTYINPTKFSKMVVVGISRNTSKDAQPYLILEEQSRAKPQNRYNHPPRTPSQASATRH